MSRTIFVFFLLCTSVLANQVRIDASSPEKLQASYAKMITTLDDEMQQKFALAMTTISVVMSQRPDLGGSAKAMEIINGKTADEIITESKKLTSFMRKAEKTLRANTANEFSSAVGNMLLSLPDGKREEFSEAVAKLLYDYEKKQISEADFLKKVNGKTAEEIIDIAKNIEVPFAILNNNKNKEYKIEKLSDQELEKLGIKKKPDTKKQQKFLEFKESLVPSTSM